ncbi:hypothetical protein BS47DRAFT_1393809 [Hydnum rufescens UP504]|uniref:Uncharacterized protein n=1 Tax=Hydnum rufescens UP504 TaxID=1448309 RepID=A0A9P6AVV4_9AGAM|nr:hypothetical protein BS47DRAFT_1393809 [Hydnum rufescens UP504]
MSNLSPQHPNLRAVCERYPAIDNHAHPLLKPAYRDAMAFEATEQLAKLFGLSEDATWEKVKTTRRGMEYLKLCRTCFEPSGIQCILIDDGLGGSKDLAEDYKWHDRLTTSPTKRIIRLETSAEEIVLDIIKTIPLEDFGYSIGDISRCSTPSSRTERASLSLLQIPRQTSKDPYAMPLRAAHKPFNDYIIRTALNLTKKPVQFHTGLGDADLLLATATPTLLQPLIRAYPGVTFVLLHSSWPFSQEAGYLAAMYKNVFLDFGENCVPLTKSCGLRTGIGGLRYFTLALSKRVRPSTDVLGELVMREEMTEKLAIEVVKAALFGNANRVYALGLEPYYNRAVAAAVVVSTRSSRKRAAADDIEAGSVSKRPKRGVVAAAARPAATTASRKSAPARRTTAVTRTKAPPLRRTAKKIPDRVEVVVKPRVPRVPKPKAPTLNALIPLPPPRPAPLHAFVFGNGDAGQFGLGTEVLSEIGRPKIHAWVEDAIKDNKYGGKGLETIVAGGMHTLAVTSDGQVWSWGVNDEGALGRKVTDVPNPQKPEEMLDREELESTQWCVAIGADGLVKAWGSFHSSSGSLGFQVGSNASRVQSSPTSVPFINKVQFCAIATGANHVVGLSVDGKVYTWGAGEAGTLGRKIVERRILNGTRPDQLHLRKIVAIGSGWYHSFAVDVDGDVFAWGLNQYGQLGIEVPNPSHGDNSNVIWTPTEVPELSPSTLGGARVVQIDGGEHHTLFLLSDGRVFGAGRVDSSQLGLPADHPEMNKAKKNEKDYVAPPTQIFFPPPPTKDEPNPVLPPYSESAEKEINNLISKISVSGRGNLVISEAGYAYSWGYGASCQLGLGPDVEEQNTPTRVRWKGSDDWFVEDASAGGQHCFILASDRALKGEAHGIKKDEAMDGSA